MAAPKPQGVITTEDFEGLVRALGSIGAANMHDRAIGFGRPKHGALVGKFNAVWSEVVIGAATDLSQVDVPHSLGAVPVRCILEGWSDTAADIAVAATPVFQERWTNTTAIVRVFKVLGAGSLVGARLSFMVGGE